MPRNRGRGTSLAEVIVVSGIMLMLMGLLTAIYVRGSAVWQKVDQETELLRELQTVFRNLERRLATSHSKGLSTGEKSLAYLSLKDAENAIATTEAGPVWQKFVAVYVDDLGLLREREIPRSAPDANAVSFKQETSNTLEEYLTVFPDNGARRLTHSGQVTTFKFSPAGDYGSLHEVEVEALNRRGSGDARVEKLHLKMVVSVRNF